MKAEIVRQELKHKKQWDELKSINIANEKELEQIQVTPISVRCGHVMLSRSIRFDECFGCIMQLQINVAEIHRNKNVFALTSILVYQ